MESLSKTRFTFCKAERLCSLKRIEALFAGGNKSFSSYPFRAVYMPVSEPQEYPVQLLISVSKRHFKHAVDRNRIKRLTREAYRKHKYILWDALTPTQSHLALAIIYLSDDLADYATVEQKIVGLLTRVAESLNPIEQNPS